MKEGESNNMSNMVFGKAEMLAFAVKRSDGTIDVETTTAKFHSQLARMVASRETETSTIATKVDEVFDSSDLTSGIYLPVGFLMARVLHVVGADNQTHGVWTKRIKEYLDENASSDRESGKLFHVKKGVGGGYARRRNLPPV